MALTWTAKAPGDVYRYTWTPPLAEGDSLASYTIAVSGAVIDSDERQGDDVIAYVSGGAAGASATFTLTGVSAQGEEFYETIYLPITASTAAGQTVRDVCRFALRKVIGNGDEPDADQLADAVERMDDMLRMWKATGGDCGVPFPLAADTVLKIDDWRISAIKHNMVLEVADLYGFQPNQRTIANAVQGLNQVKQANIPSEPVEYF
jgi:uncharacterized protein (DUF697 family)